MGKCLGGICHWDMCLGGTCPGFFCPVTIMVDRIGHHNNYGSPHKEVKPQ